MTKVDTNSDNLAALRKALSDNPSYQTHLTENKSWSWTRKRMSGQQKSASVRHCQSYEDEGIKGCCGYRKKILVLLSSVSARKNIQTEALKRKVSTAASAGLG